MEGNIGRREEAAKFVHGSYLHPPCSWWWTGRPGVLRFMGSQRVGHDWVTELNCLILDILKLPAQPTTHINTQPKYLIVVIQLLSRVWLLATPWTIARQAPLFYGILQARTLEWVAIFFSRGLPGSGIESTSSTLAGRFFATEPPKKPNTWLVNVKCLLPLYWCTVNQDGSTHRPAGEEGLEQEEVSLRNLRGL